MIKFEIIGPIREVRTIAVGPGIRDARRLRRQFGGRRWFKRAGVATIRVPDGRVALVEIHWYEAQGIGKREFRIKRTLEDPQ